MTEALQLIEIRPDFSEDFDNIPDFSVRINREPKFGAYDERHRLYVAADGPLVTFFTWAGKPDHGFGGWRRTIELKAGGTLEVIGGWSSGATSVCAVYPEYLCVPAAYYADGWDHIGSSCGLLVEPLVDWYIAHQHEVDWGIYLFDGRGGPRVVPSKGRFVKPMDDGTRWAARLLPESVRYGHKLSPMEHKWRAEHRAHFLEAVKKAYAKTKPSVDPLDMDQRAAADA